MVYDYLPIVLFVVELGLIGYYIFSALKNQKFISKGQKPPCGFPQGGMYSENISQCHPECRGCRWDR